MVTIRRATLEDAPILVDYMDALIAEKLDTIGRRDPITLQEETDFLRKAEQAERAFLLLAIESERVIGMLDLWAGTRPYNRHVGQFGMSVAKAYRGKGIGRQLLKGAIAEARKWDGFCRMELECAPWNVPAIRLYESMGFVTEARKVKSLNLRGTPDDSLLMALVW